jgi:hypothetical protein
MVGVYVDARLGGQVSAAELRFVMDAFADDLNAPLLKALGEADASHDRLNLTEAQGLHLLSLVASTQGRRSLSKSPAHDLPAALRVSLGVGVE